MCSMKYASVLSVEALELAAETLWSSAEELAEARDIVQANQMLFKYKMQNTFDP